MAFAAVAAPKVVVASRAAASKKTTSASVFGAIRPATSNVALKSSASVARSLKLSASRVAASVAPRRAAVKCQAFSEPQFKVAVLGAAGGIGQPLSLLLKMNTAVKELALYDIMGTPGVAADLSHCNTCSNVKGYTGDEELEACLTGCDLVIIPAGVPRKPGMTRDDLFNINAGIVKTLVEGVAKYCPNAIINIISNPVNSTVPIAAEVLKAAGVYDPKKVFGVTTLDIVRANTFVAEAKGLDPMEVDVPVIGGHAGETILPLLSQTSPSVSFTPEELETLTTRIQNAGTEVVEAKAGKGSATLSMAYAAARFGEACLRGLSGEEDVFECTFVASEVTELPFFSSKVRLGPNGAEEIFGLGELSDFEKTGLEKCNELLIKSIEKGEKFGAGEPASA